MSPPRVFWDAVDGWTVETPVALTHPQVERIVAWTKKVQGPRVAAMRGDKREQAGVALAALTSATLKQRVIAKPNQERVLYARD